MNPRLLITLISFFFCITCSKEKDTPTPKPVKEVIKYKLIVKVNEGGSINVKSGEYASGSKISISATASNGYEFSKWSGINSTENPVSITIDKDITVEPVFVKKNYSLTVDVVGKGKVTEKIVSASRSTDYEHDTTVELTATPENGWIFDYWIGLEDKKKNPIELKIQKSQIVTATFVNEKLSKIIGVWKFDVSTTAQKSGRAINQCKFFGLVLTADFSFKLYGQSGTISGTYQLGDDSKIILVDLGEISNLSFDEDKINLDIKMKNGCEIKNLRGKKIESGEGEKEKGFSSFLEKNNETYWKSENGNTSRHKLISITDNLPDQSLDYYEVNNGFGCLEFSKSSSDHTVKENFERLVIEFDKFKGGKKMEGTLKIINENTIEFSENYDDNNNDNNLIYTKIDKEEFEALSQEINCPNLTYIPDEYFEQGLVDLKVDDKIDKYVLTSKIESLERLELIDKNISNITGIENFKGLRALNLNKNNINEINLSNLTKLKELNLIGNGFTDIDVKSCTELTDFSASENKLSKINLSKNPSLKNLYLERNQLTELDISRNGDLEYIYLNENHLESLNVKNNTKIILLDVEVNKLNTLDVSNNYHLKDLWVGNYSSESNNKNSITTLNLKNNTRLISLNADNLGLTELNLEHNRDLTTLRLISNTNIKEINLSKNSKLEYLLMSENNLKKINISHLSSLKFLDLSFSNNLTSIDISANPKLVYFNLQSSPLIKCVQISESQYENQIKNKSINGKSEFPVRINSFNLLLLEKIQWLIDDSHSYSEDCVLFNINSFKSLSKGDQHHFDFGKFYVTEKFGGSKIIEGSFRDIEFHTVRFCNNPDDSNGIWVSFNYREDNDKLLYVFVGKRDNTKLDIWSGDKEFYAPGNAVDSDYQDEFYDINALWKAVVAHINKLMGE